MNYTIPITEANKSQIENIKRLNAMIKEHQEAIRFNADLPKTPTGRTTKSVRDHIANLETGLDGLNKQRGELLDALKADIYDWIDATTKKRTTELLSVVGSLMKEDSHHFSRVLVKAFESSLSEPVMKSETLEWHLEVASNYDGCISINLNSNSRRSAWGDYSLKRSNRERNHRKYSVSDWIGTCEFQLTEAGLEFKTSTKDSYSLFTTQVDNLMSGDVQALITLLVELNRVQNYLNANADLGDLNLLSNTCLWLEKVFDI